MHLKCRRNETSKTLFRKNNKIFQPCCATTFPSPRTSSGRATPQIAAGSDRFGSVAPAAGSRWMGCVKSYAPSEPAKNGAPSKTSSLFFLHYAARTALVLIEGVTSHPNQKNTPRIFVLAVPVVQWFETQPFSPTGRGNGFRSHSVSVRIRKGLPVYGDMAQRQRTRLSIGRLWSLCRLSGIQIPLSPLVIAGSFNGRTGEYESPNEGSTPSLAS